MEPEPASSVEQNSTILPEHRRGLTVLEVVAILLIVALVFVMMLPLLARRRQTMRREACVNNLKELGIILNLYANENRDRYPPIDNTKNNFIFDANLLYPEYLSDPMLAMCPADPRWDPATNFRLTANHPVDGTPKGQPHPDCFTGDSYIYLGWLAITDKEVEAFFKAYDNLPIEDYDTNIRVPEGSGNGDRDRIHRLSAGCGRFLIKDINFTGSDAPISPIVPIMWDRPYTDASEFSHRPVGGNVLFLDGHVEYMAHASKSPSIDGRGIHTYSPETETMARLLEERPRARIPGCDK